jgi:hypothetical protein
MLLQQLEENPQLWNEHPERKDWDGSPHAMMSDIWVRFRPKDELTETKHYAEPHIPAWYHSRHLLTEVERISLDLLALTRGVQLGGVLITKIPPKGRIYPHDDKGRWHPEFFNYKLYIPLKSNEKCLNHCNGETVIMKVGDVWFFDNLKVHSVENNGDDDRITLIVCIRRE